MPSGRAKLQKHMGSGEREFRDFEDPMEVSDRAGARGYRTAASIVAGDAGDKAELGSCRAEHL